MREKLRVCLVVLILVLAGNLLAQPASANVTANPTSVSFGSVTVSTTSSGSTIVLTNNGSHSINIQKFSSSLSQFVVSGPAMPYSLPSQKSVSFTVVFKPMAASLVSGTISFSLYHRQYSTGVTVPVSGTGVNATSSLQLSSSPTSLNFGSILVGSSASLNATLSNTGTGSVTVSQLTASGSGFTASGLTLPLTLSAGQTATFAAKFNSTAVGAFTGSVSVASNATNSPAAISLSASGVQPQISVVPTSVGFGNVTVNLTNTQTVTVRNPGTAALTLSQANVTGTGFAKSGITLPVTIAAGGSTAFTVSFTPTTASTTAGTLALVSNAPTPSLSVMLSGTGVTQSTQLTANPASINFGSVTVQTSKSQTVTLTNSGNSSISLSQLTVAGTGFSQSGLSMPLTLAAGQSTTFNAIFDPATSGALSGTATVVSNATNSPTTIALSGSGTAPATHSVNLSWNGATGDMGYYVYVATISGGPYTRLVSSPMTTTSYTDAGVTSGQTYFFVTTAIDSSGLESAYSNEATAVIP